MANNQLVVHSMDDMSKMAEAVAQSGLFGMKSWQQALALMLVAQAEGQHPATITQDYDIIQGRAARKTHSVLARFQQMGGKVEWHELSDTVADATFSHPSGGALRIKWTIDMAKKAKLTGKDNWQNYPRAMLRARVIAEGVRAIYPAAIGGMLVAEEARDMEPKDMGAAEVVSDAPKSKPANEKPALPELPAERLDAIIKKFGPAIKAREFSPEEVIDDLEEKYTLTSEQISRIIDCQPALIEGEAA